MSFIQLFIMVILLLHSYIVLAVMQLISSFRRLKLDILS